jgi:hypothetical protein
LLRSIVIYCTHFDTSEIEFSGEAFTTRIAVGDGI